MLGTRLHPRGDERPAWRSSRAGGRAGRARREPAADSGGAGRHGRSAARRDAQRGRGRAASARAGPSAGNGRAPATSRWREPRGADRRRPARAVGADHDRADRARAPVPVGPARSTTWPSSAERRARLGGHARARPRAGPASSGAARTNRGSCASPRRGASTACCGGMPYAIMLRKHLQHRLLLHVAARRAERHEQRAVLKRHGRRRRQARPLAAARPRSDARARASPASRAARHDAADARHHRRVHVRIARRGREAVALRVDHARRRTCRACPAIPRRGRAPRRGVPFLSAAMPSGSPAGGMLGPRAILADQRAAHVGVRLREQRVGRAPSRSCGSP